MKELPDPQKMYDLLVLVAQELGPQKPTPITLDIYLKISTLLGKIRP